MADETDQISVSHCVSAKPYAGESTQQLMCLSIDSYVYLVGHQVMPPIWCRLDRLWFGHPGTLEGSMTRQPFICPLDHVFEVIDVNIYFLVLLCKCLITP